MISFIAQPKGGVRKNFSLGSTPLTVSSNISESLTRFLHLVCAQGEVPSCVRQAEIRAGMSHDIPDSIPLVQPYVCKTMHNVKPEEKVVVHHFLIPPHESCIFILTVCYNLDQCLPKFRNVTGKDIGTWRATSTHADDKSVLIWPELYFFGQ